MEDATASLSRSVLSHSHAASSSSANRARRTTSRSSAGSPVPRNRIGTSSSRRSATTAPPRAVPSSLVTMSPVGPHRLGEELSLLHRVLAHGPVQHQQRLVRAHPARGGRSPGRPSAAPPSDPSWVCSRPAVSMMTRVSIPRDSRGFDGIERHRRRIAPRRARHAGNAEPLGPDLELRDRARRGRCRRRRAAPIAPSRSSRRASLAIVVVLPTPFTPTTRMTVGPVPSPLAICSGWGGPWSSPAMRAVSARRRSASVLRAPFRT